MKICPRCQKTYTDDNLNFCLEDGSVLSVQSAGGPMADTMLMNEPRPTQPQPQAQQQPGGQPGWNVAPQQPQPQYPGQPPKKKSSKAWIWIVLILIGAMLLCGGGAAALIFWAANQPEFTTNTTSNNRSSQTSNKSSPNSTTTTSSTSDRDDVQSIDLSGWDNDFSIYGTTEYTDDGEFVMASKSKRQYYVVVADKKYQTDDADTRVTLRNVDDMASGLGYGLIFHSNPTPLQQDYAFLIDTKKKKYRVVHHEPGEESLVVKWTTSDAIKEGSAENVLEARDLPDKIELYINGTMVTSIKNVYGYAGGVPGLYAGDAAKIAFKDLEIRK